MFQILQTNCKALYHVQLKICAIENVYTYVSALKLGQERNIYHLPGGNHTHTHTHRSVDKAIGAQAGIKEPPFLNFVFIGFHLLIARVL